MNARFLERFIVYRENHRLDLMRLFLSEKIDKQYAVVRHKHAVALYTDALHRVESIPEALLIEARAAQHYWKLWSERLGTKAEWHRRKAHGDDPVNTLLDIGYHYATGRIIKICQDINLPTELGIFHKAQSGRAHPLAYDFVEWIRAYVIDRELMTYIRKKKKPIVAVDEKMIKYFIFRIKKSFERYYYHKKLGYCISLEYWLRLNLLEFMGAVNTKSIYHPLFPSLRHETRCKKPPHNEAV